DASVASAPHHAIMTSVVRTRLSRTHSRASERKRSADAPPPPCSRKRTTVGRKYASVHATPATAQIDEVMMGAPSVPFEEAVPSATRLLSANSGATGIQNVAMFMRPTGSPMNAAKDSGGLRLHAG